MPTSPFVVPPTLVIDTVSGDNYVNALEAQFRSP